VTFSVFESSCHLSLPVLPLKGRGNPFKRVAHGRNKRTCRFISTLTLLNAERQAGKLWIPSFKVFWSDSARESNPGSTPLPPCPCGHTINFEKSQVFIAKKRGRPHLKQKLLSEKCPHWTYPPPPWSLLWTAPYREIVKPEHIWITYYVYGHAYLSQNPLWVKKFWFLTMSR